jgi:hypothetical protein
MSKVNLDNNLFDYNNNRHDDETVSLASSFISSYNNNIDNNIKDLVDIINGGGKSIVKHRNKKPSSSASQCVLTTIKEQQQSTYNNDLNLNMNVMPSDSVSNIGGNDNDSAINADLYNELKNITTNNTTTIKNSMPNNNDEINDSINKLSSILQHNNNNNTQSQSFDKPIHKKQTPSLISNTKSIFDQNENTAKLNQDNVNDNDNDNHQQNNANSSPLLNTTTSTSIFDNNKNLQNDFIYTGGLDNSDFYSNLLIALFIVFSFCVLGVSCICSLISPNVVYTFSFVLLICLFVIYIDKFK